MEQNEYSDGVSNEYGSYNTHDESSEFDASDVSIGDEGSEFDASDVSIDEDGTAQAVKRDIRGAGLFFFLLMILEIPVAVVIGMVQLRFPSEKGTLISVLMTQCYLLLAAVVYILVTGKSFRDDLQVRKYKVSTFFLSLLVLICASPMATWLNVFSQFFATNDTSRAIFEITENVPAWLAVLIIGCLPGFVEETIYRGIMYSAFRKHSIIAGALISALSFGLMHLNFNQMLYAIYLGLVFAFLVEATGSLASTMILHMIFNAVNTCYLFVLPALLELLKNMGVEQSGLDMEELLSRTPEKSELMSSLQLFTPMAILGLFLTVLLIRKISEINGRNLSWKSICEKREGAQNVRPVGVCLILGWIFCLVFSIINL